MLSRPCLSTLQRCRNTSTHLNHRSIHTATINVAKIVSPTDSPEERTDYRIFYRFPHIRLARLLTRLKLFQTGLTVLMIPPAWHFYSAGLVGLDSCVKTVGISMFACLMLYIMSGYLRRLVGLAAINDKETVVRLSCLNFWGKRHDLYVDSSDLVPLMDLSERPSDVYVVVRRYSTDDVMYLSLKYGVITDRELFTKVFGNVLSKQS